MKHHKKRELEKAAYYRRRGKWSDPGIPHKGWRIVEVTDLRASNAPFQVCAMCESQEIRFVHTLKHDNYGELEVGCVCAEHMTGDYKTPRANERALENRAARRASFPTRKDWKVSRRGVPYINVDGYHVVILRKGAGYCVRITPPGGEEQITGGRFYLTLEEARLGAFDFLEHLKEESSSKAA